MDTFFTVLMVVLLVLLPIYRGARKQLEADQSLPRKRRQIMGGAESETDEESETPFGVDDLGEPYFSYEYEEAPVQKPKKAPKSVSRPNVAKEQQPVRQVETVEPAKAPWVDLRQAVICQTVLCNPYIPEINQQNQ